MLVNSVAYKDGKKIADVAREDIRSWRERDDCILWVAVRDPEPHELEQLEKEFDLHPLAVEDARHGHQRPKFEEYGDSLFFVLHMLEGDGDDLRAGEVDIFVARNYVLSVRSRSERNFQDVRTRCEREPELMRHGTGYILYALMDAVVDRYFPILDDIETRLETIEDQIFAGKSPTRKHRGPLRPQAEAGDTEACDSAAARGSRQAARRTGAAALRRAR